MSHLSREETIVHARAIASEQPGGTLATTHAEDGTPYVTYVLFHLLDDGRVLFGSGDAPQHTRNILATPEVSFLIDNREVVRSDWTHFDRVVIEGSAASVGPDDERYEPFLAALAEKNAMAAHFSRQGTLFSIEPRRLILMKGLEPHRNIVEFSGP